VTAASAKKLKGGRTRNMSLAKVSALSLRPPYPHILEVGISEMTNATKSGLSGSWFATFLNARNNVQGVQDYELFAEYNMGAGSSADTERMVTRLGLQRPLCYQSVSRAGFYNDNGQDGLSSIALPWDGLIPQEEWHSEFSRSIGMAMRWRQFNIDVSNMYHSQRIYGKYGMADHHVKENGNPYSPYERLYNLLYEFWDINALNIPSHLLANMTLADIVLADTALLTDIVPGITSDTWVNQHAVIIRQDAYDAGMNSLHFGTLMDNENNLRYIVQPPVETYSLYDGSDEVKACVYKVRVAFDELYRKLDGTPITAEDLFTNGGAGIYLGETELDELPGSLKLAQDMWALGMAEYEPLSGSLSSWALPHHVEEARNDPAAWSTYRLAPADPDDLTLINLDLSKTYKIWQLRGAELRNWCLAVSRILTPEYLATNFARVSDMSVAGGAGQSDADISVITDLINWNAAFMMKFNPIKQISANNGPFAVNRDGMSLSAWQERYWSAPPMVGHRTYTEQKAKLEQLFSGMHMKTGVGYSYTDLPSYFALLNPRWLERLFLLDVQSSVNKRERYITVPAGRTGSQNTMFSTQDATTAMSHLLTIESRIFGSFRCKTTAPLSDVIYGDNVSILESAELTVVESASSSGTFAGHTPSFYPLGQKLLAEPNWDRGNDSVDLSVTVGRSGRAGYENNLVVTSDVVVEPGSPLESQLRGQHGAFLGEGGMLVSPDGLTTVDIDTRELRIIEPDAGLGHGQVYLRDVAGGSSNDLAYLEDVLEVADLDHDAVNVADWYAWLAAEGYPFTGVEPLAFTSDDTLHNLNASNRVSWTYRLRSARVTNSVLGLPAGSTLWFQTQSYTSAPHDSTKVRAAPQRGPTGSPGMPISFDTYNNRSVHPVGTAFPVVVLDGGELAEVSYPDVNGTPVAFTPYWREVVNWIVWNAFPFDRANGATVNVGGTDYYPLPAAAAYSDQDVSGVTGSYSVTQSAYLTPQNEDVFYEQRRHEFDASIYAYSNGQYVPAVLNADNHNYAYYGALDGFARDRLFTLLPEQVTHMRLSVSPYATDSVSVLRVVKEVYTPYDYQQLLKRISIDAANGFTAITAEEFINIQQMLVRSGQSAK
jgi:hypothetical protein